MNVKSIERKGNEATVVVEIDKELMESGVNKAYMKARKSIQLPGFRKGKAPRKMIEAMYGAHVFYEDGLEEIFPEIYDFAIAKQDFKAIGRPNLTDMQIGDDNIVTLTLTTEVYPEVTLGQYKGLAVTRHVRPVTDKTVDIELVHQTRMHAVYHPTTEPAKRGFRALLDFAGYMDGKEIPDSRMEKVMVVLGDGKLMPAAEQAIYGHRAGEVFRFDFTYPQDFRLPELSGKTAQFEIELRSLAEKVTPAPDEAFAKSLGFDSLDALKADLRAKKQKIHEEGADRAAGKQLLDMAGANMTVDLPAEILDRTAQNEMKLLKERLSRSGITLEQHCKNSRTTPEALEKDYRAQAESRIRFVLAARAIAEAENIVVHPEEVNAEYRRLSQLQDTPEAEIRKALPEDTIAAALAAKKVQRFLLDNAQVTTVTDAPEKE